MLSTLALLGPSVNAYQQLASMSYAHSFATVDLMIKETEKRTLSNTKWQQAVIYEIYIKSFNESNKSKPTGHGDLRGVIERLDYLSSLGVNAVWLCPFYPSPQVDDGYDVTDHCAVDPLFGTMEDFDNLVQQAHQRKLGVMIDLIPNHTSDQHDWFQDSVNHGDKADWYIWRDAKPDGSPPNNWASVFSKKQHLRRKKGEITVKDGEFTPPLSAWTFNEIRGQYYLHSFSPEQPDLNWQNPEVREAIKKIMRFWLARDIDGFRVDAIPYLGKNPSFQAEDPNQEYDENNRDAAYMTWPNPYDQLQLEHSGAHMETLRKYLTEISSVLDEYPRDLRIIYEAYLPPEKLHAIDSISSHNSSSFNFTALDINWDASSYKIFLDEYYGSLPPHAIGNHVRGNHDRPRAASPDALGKTAARAVALMNLTLPGNIFIYNGEEGGFTDVALNESQRHDTYGFRDESRTPMLWDASLNAGFSTAHPDQLWLPIDPDYEQKSLAKQAKDPRSFLSLYRALLSLRNSHPALQAAGYTPLETNNQDVLAFGRQNDVGKDQVITLVNFSDEEQQVIIKNVPMVEKCLISSYMDESQPIQRDNTILLRANEAIVLQVDLKRPKR